MASAGEEENEISGRRTRSGRKVSASHITQSPARATRRASRRHAQDHSVEYEAIDIQKNTKSDQFSQNSAQSDIIKEMLAEAAQGVITNNEQQDVVSDSYDDRTEVIETVEIIEDTVQQDYSNDCIIYEEEEEHLEQDEDVEMYAVHTEIDDEEDEEPPHTNVPVASEGGGIDEKSSSFPFGTVGHSETSEDLQNEEEEEVASGGINKTGAVESSLLASMAGDNANSLPSVAGCEETDSKKADFGAKVIESTSQQIHCDELVQSDDSLSEPAIAEDLATGADASNATIVNTELVSEDELPLPTKPEINDAEEVSDDELPAPQRAELPADAEVISEDELPATASTENKSPDHDDDRRSSKSDTPSRKKRKADDECIETGADKHKSKKSERPLKKSDEQYNPMSPTTESNDAMPPVEKKTKIDGDSDQKDIKNEKDKERDKEREREKERKKLPDLEKYWRAVKDDVADFTGWTYLLQYVDNENDAEAAREAYDAFLSHYPYCYGYWRKYADYEKRKGIKTNCNMVFERGLKAIPLSVDLWIHYLAHVKNMHGDTEDIVRAQFERAIDACGLEFRSDKLWDAYIKWELDGKRYQRVVQIYDRLLAIPTQGYSGHFDNFQDLINQHSIVQLLSQEELKKVLTDLRELSRSSLSARAKNRRGSSKDKDRTKDRDDKERDYRDERRDESSQDQRRSRSPIDKKDTAESLEYIGEERDPAKRSDDLSDPSTLTDEELSAIKDKVISLRRKVHKATVASVTARWTFEEGIKRPYFHVKPLERCQLKNWKDYLDFEIEKGDRKRVLVLFERCLIACALYDEFWLKMIRYLETQLEQSNAADVPVILSDVYRRACQIHHPDKPSLHLMWSAFEECQNNYDRAADILVQLEKRCTNLLQIAYRRINVERRRGDLTKCRELYEHYIATAKNKTIAGSLVIKYARFLNKICGDLDAGLLVLRHALEKDVANTRVALQMVDLSLQRSKVNEEEVVLIMDKFMARENIDPDQKVLFAQRKVEFLEDFGSTAKGLQDAQRALQLAIGKANEAKKKRESSPSRKTSTGVKESLNAAGAQAAYNNGSSAANAGYNYGATNSPYYNQQNNSSGAYPQQQQQQQSYDNYYNHWQYGSGGYSGYGQWSGYGNYY